jgi:hypothetical protein
MSQFMHNGRDDDAGIPGLARLPTPSRTTTWICSPMQSLESAKGRGSMEQKLMYVLALVNEWLRYAEAKNGVLTALAGASLAGVGNALATATSLSRASKALGACTAICVGLSCLIALLSFVPRVNRRMLLPGRKGVSDAEKDNLLFFGDLAKYTPDEFLNAMARQYFQNNSYVVTQQKADRNLADQIVLNSRITVAKLQFFKMSIWVLIAAIPAGLAALFCHLFFN